MWQAGLCVLLVVGLACVQAVPVQREAELGHMLVQHGVAEPVPTANNVQHFEFTGRRVDWIVPPGVDAVTFHLFGAAGASGVASAGAGAYVSAKVEVQPGDTFTLSVGQGGSEAGTAGFGGGGSGGLAGGGASKLEVNGNVIAIAAGGGGAGGKSDRRGGAGGALVGSRGGTVVFFAGREDRDGNGGGGSQVAGGHGDLGGEKGVGGSSAKSCGGGGGGYFGGGAGILTRGVCGGGGGGSSYLNAQAVIPGSGLFLPGEGSVPGGLLADVRQGANWGRPHYHGHIALELTGESLKIEQECGTLETTAAPNCMHIKENCEPNESGFYWVQTTSVRMQVYCENDQFDGGWALVGFFCPECDELDGSGDAFGTHPLSPTMEASARLSDLQIQSFGEATFWVRGSTSLVANTNCNTFYRLVSPTVFHTSASYDALQCSFNGVLYGPTFRPSGNGLTTQSGPMNWEKTSCGDGSRHSSQWIYTYPPQSVNGRDLCVNGGEETNAFKWLYLRPSNVEVQSTRKWRLVASRDKKVYCNDPDRWPADGHPKFLAPDLSLDDCKAACSFDEDCTAIDYSPNLNGAVDESGLARSKCFFHSSVAACNNFRAFSSPTYNFEVWELKDSAAAMIAPHENATESEQELLSCNGDAAKISKLSRKQAVKLEILNLQASMHDATLAALWEQAANLVDENLKQLNREVAGEVRFGSMTWDEEWEMRNGDMMKKTLSKLTGMPMDRVVLTGVRNGSVIVDYTVLPEQAGQAQEAAKAIEAAAKDGTLERTLAMEGFSECDGPNKCQLSSTKPVVKVESNPVLSQINSLASKQKVVEKLRKALLARLGSLDDDEVFEELVALATQLGKSPEEVRSLPREENIAAILELSIEGKSMDQLKATLRLQYTTDPLAQTTDAHGCIGNLGFTWCSAKAVCVQNFAGGFNAPCTTPEEQDEPYWQTLEPAALRRYMVELAQHLLSKRSTMQIKTKLMDSLSFADSDDAQKKNLDEVDEDPESRKSCPDHSSGDAVCVCDKGYKGGVNLVQNTGQCDKVQCPDGSDGHPDCACREGHAGMVEWNPSSQQYEGVCAPCGKGFRTSEHSDMCVIVNGPPHTRHHPDLECVAGFGGAIVWNTTRQAYDGKCTPCAQGTWAEDGEAECVEVPCPENAIGWPSCVCEVGHTGSLAWAEGKYSGACTKCRAGSFKPHVGAALCELCGVGFWAPSGATGCERVDCPANAGDHPQCRCEGGTVGQVQWGNDGTYWGACEECKLGFVESADQTECVPIQCPEHSLWPECVCEEGRVGAPEVGVGGDVTGACERCPEGYWCSGGDGCRTQADCRKVECPKHAASHPACACRDGFKGAVAWDGLSGTYQGQCEPCPAGQWADDDTRAGSPLDCVEVPCPKGAEGYPNCRCKLGYVGTVSWVQDEGVWTGACAKCPKGMWSVLPTDLQCAKVPCPPLAAGWPDCQCPADHPADNGALAWNDELGKYEGACGDVRCPPNSAGFPDCTCNAGYRGSVVWSASDLEFVGGCDKCPEGHWSDGGAAATCDPVPCPENSGGWPECVCSAGFFGTLSPPRDWEVVGVCRPCDRGFWSADNDTECAKVDCPAHASGHPHCQCDRGFQGKPEWVNGAWEGTPCTRCEYGYHAPFGQERCSRIACPPYSSGWPRCRCDEGYQGTLALVEGEDAYRGQCVRCPMGYGSVVGEAVVVHGPPYSAESACRAVECPDHATGWPVCHCRPGYFGSLDLFGAAWLGACEPCPQGFGSQLMQAGAGPRKCVLEACPPFSDGHPDCACRAGFFGHVRWNAQTAKFEGACEQCREGTYTHVRGLATCLPCAAGTWSGKGAASCEASVPCPEDTIPMHDGRCGCAAGYQGSIHFDAVSGSYVGKCARCLAGEWSEAGSTQCFEVECPERTESFHPACACQRGDAGSVAWDALAGKFDSTCAPCERGTWPDGDRCKDVPCPEFAKRSADGSQCVCEGDRRGNIVWADGVANKFRGLCTPCTKGFAVSESHLECVPVPCPEHAGFHPNCRCLPGYAGTVEWTAGKFVGSCEACPPGTTGTVECAPVACPPLSSPGDQPGLCFCDKGFQGLITWDSAAGAWKGDCTQADCPLHARRSGDDGSGPCVCNDNYENHLLGEDGGRCAPCAVGMRVGSAGLCEKVECPDNSQGWPLCRCDVGFVGVVGWAVDRFVGSCEPCPHGFTSSENNGHCVHVKCPPESQGHPDCQCVAPFQGKIEFNATRRAYEGVCTECDLGFAVSKATGLCERVDCPDGAVGWPHCECPPHFVGTVRWERGEYEARCEECPVGTDSVSGPSGKCEHVAPPPHSFDPASPRCVPGFAGELRWNDESHSFVGQCEQCLGSEWSNDDATFCSKVPCPAGTTERQISKYEAVCDCDSPLVGELRMVQGSWVGQCVEGDEPPSHKDEDAFVPSASASPAPKPSHTYPSGSCLAAQEEAASKGECEVQCVEEGVYVGGAYRSKQCCDDECWCVDPLGKEIALSRHNLQAGSMTCWGVNCLQLDLPQPCVAALGSKADFKMTKGSFVVEAWVRIAVAKGARNSMVLFGTTGEGAANVTFSFGVKYQDQMPRLRMQIGEAVIVSEQSVPEGVWAHVAYAVEVRKDGRAMALYVNGAKDTFSKETELAPMDDGERDDLVFLGRMGDAAGGGGSAHFIGSIGKVVVWGERIRTEQIALAMRNELDMFGAKLTATVEMLDSGYGYPRIAVVRGEEHTEVELSCSTLQCTDAPGKHESGDPIVPSPSPVPSHKPKPPAPSPDPVVDPQDDPLSIVHPMAGSADLTFFGKVNMVVKLRK